MIGNPTKSLNSGRGAEGRAAGAGEEAPKIAGTDVSGEGNHGGGGRPYSVAVWGRNRGSSQGEAWGRPLLRGGALTRRGGVRGIRRRMSEAVPGTSDGWEGSHVKGIRVDKEEGGRVPDSLTKRSR